MLTIGDNTQAPSVTGSSYIPDDLVISQNDLVTEPITLLAGTLNRGAVLGFVTASDGYILSVRTTTDGSQIPTVILADDADASGSPVSAVGYVAGEFDAGRLIYDPSWTPELLTTAFRAGCINLKTSSADLSAVDPS